MKIDQKPKDSKSKPASKEESTKKINQVIGGFFTKKMKEKKEIDYKMKYIAQKPDLIKLICSFSKKPYK